MSELPEPSYFDAILKPGSSLSLTFFLIVDGVLAALLAVLLSLAYLTAGNLHVFGLIGVELALWASIKWVIYELRHQNSPPGCDDMSNDEDLKKHS